MTIETYEDANCERKVQIEDPCGDSGTEYTTYHRGYPDPAYRGPDVGQARESLGMTESEWDGWMMGDPTGEHVYRRVDGTYQRVDGLGD